MKQKAISPKAEVLATRIAGNIIRRQTRLANYLNRKTQHWNRMSKLIALALFVMLFGGTCIYFILKSI
jgi:hypothetical protein